jgi:hypothetical protein
MNKNNILITVIISTMGKSKVDGLLERFCQARYPNGLQCQRRLDNLRKQSMCVIHRNVAKYYNKVSLEEFHQLAINKAKKSKSKRTLQSLDKTINYKQYMPENQQLLYLQNENKILNLQIKHLQRHIKKTYNN